MGKGVVWYKVHDVAATTALHIYTGILHNIAHPLTFPSRLDIPHHPTHLGIQQSHRLDRLTPRPHPLSQLHILHQQTLHHPSSQSAHSANLSQRAKLPHYQNLDVVVPIRLRPQQRST